MSGARFRIRDLTTGGPWSAFDAGGFIANAGDTLEVQLEDTPALDIWQTRFSDEDRSNGRTAVTFSPADGIAVTPTSPVQIILPPAEFGTWAIQCQTNGGVAVIDGAGRPDLTVHTKARFVAVLTATLGLRHPLAAETTQFTPGSPEGGAIGRGVAVALQVMLDAVEAANGGGGGAPTNAAYWVDTDIMPGGLSAAVLTRQLAAQLGMKRIGGLPISITHEAAVSGTATEALSLEQRITGAGAGAGAEAVYATLRLPNGAGVQTPVTQLRGRWTTVAGGGTGGLDIYTSITGVLNLRATLDGAGSLRLHAYTSAGIFTNDGTGVLTSQNPFVLAAGSFPNVSNAINTTAITSTVPFDSTSTVPLRSFRIDASTDTVLEAFYVGRNTTTVGDVGNGPEIVFFGSNADGAFAPIAGIGAAVTDPTTDNEDGELVFFSRVDAVRTLLGSWDANTFTVDTDLIVTGDLVVNGLTTSVDSTVVEIADRLVVLNKSTGIVPVPIAITGVVIDRGSADGITKRDGVAIVWNETASYAGVAYNTTLDQSTLGAFLTWRAGALVSPTLDGPGATLTLGASNTSIISRPGGTNGLTTTSTGQRTHNANTGEWLYEYWGTQLRAYAKKSASTVNATPVNILQYPASGTLPDNFTASITITARMADIVSGDSAFIRRHYRAKRRAAGSVTLAEVGIGAQLVFGADNVGTTTTARYPLPGYSTGAAPTSSTPLIPSVALPLRRISYSAASAGTGVDLITATLRKNGSATSLAVSFLPTETVKTATITDPITYVPGVDTLSIEVTKANNITSSPNNIVFTVAGYGEVFRDDPTHIVGLRESGAVLFGEWTGDATNQTDGDVSLEVEIDEYSIV